MIDPILSLAHSIHTSKGTYALLIGSGVSRAASIPTGWEIVVDLASRLAAMEGETDVSDPVAWYRERFKTEPEYSLLMESLGKSREDRQRLLKGYFERSEEDQDVGSKSPTQAHLAIGRLVAKGYIRVVVTTNFDRLIEQGIERAGKTPVVVSTADAVEGALPLVHQDCCVLKLHGDYLDSRIRNSESELEVYEPRFDKLLSQVLDEFGIIICGWSGQWDIALRAAFERCPTRRFMTYWATREALRGEAEQILRHRSGVPISIASADAFFTALEEKVEALESLSASHPLTVSAAEATAKRFLSEPRYLLRLDDLVRGEVEKADVSVRSAIDRFSKSKREQNDVQRYSEEARAALEVLVAISAQGGYWGKGEQLRPFTSITARLASDPKPVEVARWQIPSFAELATLLPYYAAGTAACLSENWEAVAAILTRSSVWKLDSPKSKPFSKGVYWGDLFRLAEELAGRRSHFPLSEWLYESLAGVLGRLTSEKTMDEAFETWETLQCLSHFHICHRELPVQGVGLVDFLPGRFVYSGRFRDKPHIRELLEDRTDILNDLVSRGLFGGDVKRMKSVCESAHAYCVWVANRF